MHLIPYYTTRPRRMQAKYPVIYVNSVDKDISPMNWGCGPVGWNPGLSSRYNSLPRGPDCGKAGDSRRVSKRPAFSHSSRCYSSAGTRTGTTPPPAARAEPQPVAGAHFSHRSRGIVKSRAFPHLSLEGLTPSDNGFLTQHATYPPPVRPSDRAVPRPASQSQP